MVYYKGKESNQTDFACHPQYITEKTHNSEKQ
jgi:hypothetical protein